jgi:hypothetical protein
MRIESHWTTRRRALAAAALCLGIANAALNAQRGRAPAAKLTPLTPRDYLEIQQLVARSGYALDSGAPEGTGREYASLFTEDGMVVGPGIANDSHGREKLAALARIPPGDPTRRGPTHLSQFLTNHLIEPSPEGATGMAYLLVVNFGATGVQSSVSMGGLYRDVYVKTPEGWRIQKRELFRGQIRLPTTWPAPSLTGIRPTETDDRTGTGSLTALDYVAIRRLVFSYAYALDIGDGDMYADLFIPDAMVLGRVRDRDAVAAIARQQPQRPQFVRHFLTNVVIEPSADGATGTQYLLVVKQAETGKPTPIDLGGRYDDVYVKTAKGWKFKARTLIRTDAPQAADPGAPGAGPLRTQ